LSLSIKRVGWTIRNEKIKKRLREILKKNKEAKERAEFRPQPRYDEVYFKGVAWLDEYG